MARKNFTIKYKEPEIKGTNRSIIKDQNGISNSKAENSASSELSATAGGQAGDSPAKFSERDKPEPESIQPQNKDLAFKVQTGGSSSGSNPFLQTRESFDPSSVIKTGYKMRVEYKQVLKLLAEMKKGYTIEALLDEALTKYFDSTPEAQNALRMMKMLK